MRILDEDRKERSQMREEKRSISSDNDYTPNNDFHLFSRIYNYFFLKNILKLKIYKLYNNVYIMIITFEFE
jgi:hypothetical protein